MVYKSRSICHPASIERVSPDKIPRKKHSHRRIPQPSNPETIMKSKSAFRLVRTGSTAACLLAAALAALFAAPPARAAIRTWDNGNADLSWTNEI